ncbi:MAG: histidine phosphatase family protein [Armatimonadota bacterium]
MIRFFIVRHGETAWNAGGRIQGHTDVELTKTGLEQAQLAAKRLQNEKIDLVYSSDLKRASVTGEAIASLHSVPVITTPLLREACLGEWQGLTLREAAEKFPKEYEAYSRDSIAHRPPEAERLEEVIARCRQFLDDVIEKHPNSSLAVACHGGSVRGILAAAFGLGPELYRRVRLDNGGITILDITDNRPLLVSLNDTCHMTKQGIGNGADS